MICLETAIDNVVYKRYTLGYCNLTLTLITNLNIKDTAKLFSQFASLRDLPNSQWASVVDQQTRGECMKDDGVDMIN